jgi:hypothetical protein
MALQKLRLFSLNPAIRRTKKLRSYELCTISHVVEIRHVIGYPSVEMIEGMATNGMACGCDSIENIGVVLDILAYAEKSGFGVILFELLEYPGSNLGHGAIIKG